MRKKNRNFLCLVIFFQIIVSPGLFAQAVEPQDAKRMGDTTYYYIDLLHRGQPEINEIRGETLNIKYDDRYSGKGEFTTELYDWQRNLLVHRSFQKKYGENHYNIPLTDFFGNWEPGKIYSLVTLNDAGKKHISYIIIPEEEEREGPDVEIVVDPVTLDCDGPESLVNFFGRISGGQGPYMVKWQVMDKNMTVALYRPRDEKVPESGHTPIIQVDSSPDYLVSMRVTDSCGAETEERVLITCGEQINTMKTIFVQPQRQLPVHQTN